MTKVFRELNGENPSTEVRFTFLIIARPTSELLFEIGVFLFCFAPVQAQFYAVRSRFFLVMPEYKRMFTLL